MSQETAKWYVIHTYSGYEALVKDSLEKLIENNNLSNVILDIKIPMEETIEEKNGKKKVVLRKILPCYVFVKMVYSNDMWFLITNSRGVTGFVGPQGKAVPLGEDEVRKMRLEERVESFDICVGDMVKIISGAMEGYLGAVEELNAEAQKAKVRVEMFGGREMSVEVDYIQLEKLVGEN
ncbi:MAG: transcription termination/antitermination factor NusG [Clostridia bacterium]|nr:transcription termination/antitermination factor NusG [Clostridia bacterium]